MTLGGGGEGRYRPNEMSCKYVDIMICLMNI